MPNNDLEAWSLRLSALTSDAHIIFGTFESAKSRSVTLDDSYSRLQGLSIRQDDLFRQSLRCVESELYRAAHVMAWAATVDCLQSLVASDAFVRLNCTRPTWAVCSIEQLGERHTEHALIEAMLAMSILSKAESKAFLGMLSKRNECAHPGSYFPTFNETLGYVAEIFSRLALLIKKFPDLKL